MRLCKTSSSVFISLKKPIMKTKSRTGNRSRKKIRILRSSSSRIILMFILGSATGILSATVCFGLAGLDGGWLAEHDDLQWSFASGSGIVFTESLMLARYYARCTNHPRWDPHLCLPKLYSILLPLWSFSHHISSARSVMHVFILMIVCVIFIHPWDSCHGQQSSVRSSRLSLRRWHCPNGWEPPHWSPVGHGYGSCTVCSQQASFCLFFVLIDFQVIKVFVFVFDQNMVVRNTQTSKPNQQLRVTWWRAQGKKASGRAEKFALISSCSTNTRPRHPEKLCSTNTN